MKSGQLGKTENVSRRYVDTEVIVSAMLLYPAGSGGVRGPHDDPRHSIATARLNWLHARWPIRNDDMLYTLRCAHRSELS